MLHVAGTNGKGSTCAFLRAMGEAAGLRVHVYTSPHLVRFNERIRLAGELVTDQALADILAEVEQVNAGAPITVFEVLVAAALLLFARVPADICVVEVGLGGRGDATNVIARPAACAIASISLDHREMLGDTLELIALEKAGIMKPGVPVVTGAQPASVLAAFAAHAGEVGAPLLARDRDWTVTRTPDGFRYADAAGTLDLPPPSLRGPHQYDNAGIAIATMRASGLPVPDAAIQAGIATAVWPARMQRLTGRLAALLPEAWELWLDGGHNPGGGVVLAEHLADWADRPAHLIVGMKQAKDSAEFLRPLHSPCGEPVGGQRTWPASGIAGGRHHRRLGRHRPPRPHRGRSPRRPSPRRPPRPRADLRQPLSGRRSIESRFRRRTNLNG